MNKIYRSVIVGLAMGFVLESISYAQQARWKGKIETENGVKAIKNPSEPMYGEIKLELEEDLSIGKENDDNLYFYRGFVFEVDKEGNVFIFDRADLRIQKFNRQGKYIQTIGRKGQGPSEFQDLLSRIDIDSSGNIYVKGRNSIQIFNNNGQFVKSTPMGASLTIFCIFDDGNVLGKTHSFEAEGFTNEIALFNSDGKKIKTFISFFRPRPKVQASIVFLHPYGQDIYCCAVNGKLGIYGYSSEYKLFVVNSSGENVYCIEKDELPQKMTREERYKPIDDHMKAAKKQGFGVLPTGEIEKFSNLTEYKPFFRDILSDDKGNIYVQKSILVIGNEIEYDLFNKVGHYLYKIKIPYLVDSPFIKLPIVIRNGNIYSGKHDKESGLDFLKRYKIKNWEQIKAGSEIK